MNYLVCERTPFLSCLCLELLRTSRRAPKRESSIPPSGGDECKFAYRKSRFSGGKQVVVSASFALSEAEREVVEASIKSYAEIRKKMQPNGKSCGSVFKNPKKHTAGALIDKVGLKGYKVGGATVSTKHGNFIITDVRAKAKDVYELIELIKKKVNEEFNVLLEEEIELVGEF